MYKVSFRNADVEGFNIFYREAGPTDVRRRAPGGLLEDILSRLVQEKRT
jgi:hypothetical protein